MVLCGLCVLESPKNKTQASNSFKQRTSEEIHLLHITLRFRLPLMRLPTAPQAAPSQRSEPPPAHLENPIRQNIYNASNIQHSLKNKQKNNNRNWIGNATPLKRPGNSTAYINPFVDDELSVPQVVEDGLKVLWAAVDEVGSVLVLLVPPHA